MCVFYVTASDVFWEVMGDFFQAEDGISVRIRSRGLGDVYNTPLNDTQIEILPRKNHYKTGGRDCGSSRVTGEGI